MELVSTSHLCSFPALANPWILLGAPWVPFPQEVCSAAVSSLIFWARLSRTVGILPKGSFESNTATSSPGVATKSSRDTDSSWLEGGFTKDPESPLRLGLLLGVPALQPSLLLTPGIKQWLSCIQRFRVYKMLLRFYSHLILKPVLRDRLSTHFTHEKGRLGTARRHDHSATPIPFGSVEGKSPFLFLA